MLKILSGVFSSLVLHLPQLCVSRNFILQDFVLKEALLFLFSILKEFKMCLLSFIILLVFGFKSHLLLDFDLGLLVELLFHEPLSLSLSGSRLLLLLKVKNCVEFLDSCPLVFLLEV